MPAVTPLPPFFNTQVFSVTQKFSFLGQICQTSFYYRANGPIVPDINTAIAELAALWIINPLGAINNMTCVGTVNFENRIFCMTSPQFATKITATAAANGLRPGDPLPPQIAQVLAKRTNFRGRHSQGRSFIGGMSETDSTNGVPTAAYTIVAQASATTLKAVLGPGTSGNSYTPVVVALKTLVNNGTPDAPIWQVRGADIISITADLIWNTQRRRTVGRGS